MSIFSDWKFWMFTLHILTIIVTIAIKFNDLRHLTKKVNAMDEKVDNIVERVSYLEGKTDSNT